MEMPDPDTIVAVGTPPGVSALAVVRLSGPRAVALVKKLCPTLPSPPVPRRVALLRLQDPDTGGPLDQVLVTFFPGPGSYTGEDLVEISCHGGWIAPALILEACVKVGARRAEEGEFSRRAFLNGKLDLLQVEAVQDLVEGRSLAFHGAAIHQLEGGLSRRIGALREDLLGLEALLVHYLDFPEEDDPPVPVGEIVARALTLEETMEDLLRTAPEGELLREGAVTVLAGRPNSGKSSLFNALLGQERAIVTESPGTTRDAIEAMVSLGGFPFRLVDTAGLRDSEEGVEKLGIEVARRYLRGADLILFCVEGEGGIGPPERRFLDEVAGSPVVLVRTKTDLVRGKGWGGAPTGTPFPFLGTVEISVRTGKGLDALKRLLPSLVFRGRVQQRPEVPVLIRKRHAEGVSRALAEVRAFRDALEKGVPAELASTHLRPAETALEELLGVIPREEVLDRLFRDFCIGK